MRTPRGSRDRNKYQVVWGAGWERKAPIWWSEGSPRPWKFYEIMAEKLCPRASRFRQFRNVTGSRSRWGTASIIVDSESLLHGSMYLYLSSPLYTDNHSKAERG